MKSILVVVDYQVDFVDGVLGSASAIALQPAITEKIHGYLQAGKEVVYTLDTHTSEYLSTQEGKLLPFPHCIKGTAGWELYGQTASLLSNCRAFEKPTFGSLELCEYLKSGQYNEVELIGVVTNICVISNAILAKAAMPEATITIDARCTASNDKALHDKALDVLESLQCRIINR